VNQQVYRFTDKGNVDQWEATTMSLAPYGQLDISLFDDALHIGGRVVVDPVAGL
jgi:hypothetical protein